jgi:glycosyltransferase involved in cell wall biosynthesis
LAPPPRISVAVITLNEADRIERLLESTRFADEVVVVDSGSTDGTVEKCLSAGARVIRRRWEGYAAQKMFAMEQACGDWILNLDGDEALSPELACEILDRVRGAPPEVVGFSMPRLSLYLNRWIRHGGWYPDRKTRLVRRGRARWKGDGIHEVLEVDGRVDRLEANLLHYVYRDIADQVRTINRFSSVFAESVPSRASGLTLVWGMFHAAGKFLECAIWKAGLLDGPPGLVIAMNSAFYVFLKHAKSWEKGLSKNISPTDASKAAEVHRP